MSTLTLDAEALYTELRAGVQQLWRPGMALMGIWSGGAWLAERLVADLPATLAVGKPGVISSALHRDDFSARGMASGTDATKIPFAVDGAHILLLDDVLFTGRTIRAVINELYDFGRPASVTLAVLVDRGGRELPIQPAFAAAKISLPPEQKLALTRTDDGRFSFSVKGSI
ncbi:bifunctional pyr operon transcriptional regulator/uracil phosphoribosyltransferase PyrR [Pseudaquabacterium pictum]|uniref:Bifunctional pyr operon transcriptional regulator/uracil phosphoribosyltransferase n=1 Tax=Pseudaquabacterium pictum TaxID=2315236 RepID=A0A480APN3_9BURK|nr:bifunctional pyr operon transcriptional regulator/uracil phosphoribosyltransferase PyrR [Rubrivivax pictus]GCL63579.1 bifunctional pyr operon transcriptional regulator/uracil phosphoribosyltransferase [Rubrivivax pictus]